ncbi:MAG: hypothetical protein GVY26_23125 [Bacteroidetes bacterium]|nr:hypothetical protein [Bacteroidota bacterium]
MDRLISNTEKRSRRAKGIFRAVLIIAALVGALFLSRSLLAKELGFMALR